MSNSTGVRRLFRAFDSEENTTDYPLDPVEYDEKEEDFILEQFYVRLILLILYSIVFVFCIFGNLMVLLVVTTHWRMKHITKFCLANLALADFCVGVFCVYQNLSTYFINNWILGEFLCKMYQFINGVSHTSSVLTLMAVCVERYLAILQPLRCKQILTKTRLKALLVGVWLASGLYCSPRLYYMSIVEVPRSWNGTETETICTARRNLYSSRTFDLINSILLFILPLVLMTVLYTRVGFVLWGTSKGHSLPIPIPNLATSPTLDGTLSETEIFGISPRDRIIEIQIGKKSPHRKLSETGIKFYGRSSSLNSLQHSRSSPNLSSQQRFPARDFNNSMNSSSLSGSELDVGMTTQREYDLDEARKKMSSAWRPPTTNNTLSFQSGLNALRRKYFLKKIQAQKQLQLRKHFLGGRDEVKLRRSVVKMLMVIVGAFAFCNFPYHLRKFAIYWWPVFDHGSAWGTLTLPISYLCMYGNCAINPVIYAIMSSSFRASFKDVVRCQWRKPGRTPANIIPYSNTLVTSSSRRSNLRLLRNTAGGMEQV